MIQRRNTLRLAFLLGLVILLASVVQAQTFRGRLQGTITDESKAVVVGASVTLLNVNTGIKVERNTNDNGHYLFDNVDPGTYSITVAMSGFNKFTQENILVQSGSDVTVKVWVNEPNWSEALTVTSLPDCTRTFSWVNLLKPVNTTVTEYVPGSTLSKR